MKRQISYLSLLLLALSIGLSGVTSGCGVRYYLNPAHFVSRIMKTSLI
jgi:hypothetical protein